MRLFGDFADFRDNPATDCLGVEVCRLILIEPESFKEFIEFRTAVDDISRVVDFREVVHDLVVFVPDFADKFFQNIFKGNNAQRSAVFVHNDSHMHFLALHAFQKRRNFHMFRRDGNGGDVVFYRIFTFFKGGEEVDIMDHTHDAVDCVFVHGHTREIMFQEKRLDFFHRHVDGHRDNVHARHENILDFRVVKLNRAGNKFALLHVKRAVFLRFFDHG